MALKWYRNKITKEVQRSLSPLDSEFWEVLLDAPSNKLMICANKATGKSKVKDLEAVLIKRARNHARENDVPDQLTLSQMNDMGEIAAKNLLNSQGKRRNILDDL